MKQYYRKSNLKNRLVLAAFLMAAILLISVYYRNPDGSFIRDLKSGAINGLAYVQLGAKKVFSPVSKGWNYMIELTNAKEENVRIKEELSMLKKRLNDLLVIAEENKRLRGLVDVPVKKDYETVMAVPVGMSSNNWEASIVIEKGTKDKVSNRMPVINQDGLVGQIINAGLYASQVQLITDVKSGVAAEIIGRNVKGLIKGTYDHDLEMSLVRKIKKVEVGDRVITSGLGGVYPRGLYIGRVKKVTTPAPALYKNIEIQTEVKFNNLQEVLVIKSPLPPDIDRLK